MKSGVALACSDGAVTNTGAEREASKSRDTSSHDNVMTASNDGLRYLAAVDLKRRVGHLERGQVKVRCRGEWANGTLKGALRNASTAVVAVVTTSSAAKTVCASPGMRRVLAVQGLEEEQANFKLRLRNAVNAEVLLCVVPLVRD